MRQWTSIGLPCGTALVALAASSAALADTYKVGDRVEVLHLNTWKPAVVANTNPRGEVLAEFEFAGRAQQQVFKPDAVRAEYESGAIARGRTWSDPSGSFKIKASLLSATDDEVKLRKTDLTELTVPVAKLSDADKAYLKKLRQAMGLAGERGPEPPPVETFAGTGGVASFAAFGANDGRPALAPDPVPAYLKLKQGGCGFVREEFFDRLGAVLPVGASDQWLLAAVINEKPGGALPTRLMWVSLARQKMERRQLLPPEEKLLDYHAPSHRVLTYNEIKENGSRGKGTLTVWEATPADTRVKPIARWYTDSDKQGDRNAWGRLLDGNLVLHRTEKQRYVAWDIAQKAARYTISQESFFAPEVALSGGRKYIFVPEDKQVRVLESATGAWATTLPATDGASGVAVSEDGRQAAVLGRSTLSVFDLTAADAAPKTYQAEAIGTPFTAELAWVGPNRLMADFQNSQRLFSLTNNLTIWRYDFDHSAVSDHWGGRVREIIDRHLVYAASVSSGGQHALAVGAVQLPGPRVDEMEAKLDRESLYIVKRGTPVRVEVNAGEHSGRIQKALEAKVQANGWTLADNAAAVLSAEMKQGEQQTVNYRMFRTGDTQSASFVPHIASLKLQVGMAVAWQSGTSTGAPPFMRLREGESVQDEVDKWQKPHPEFFDSVKIPEKILDPKYRDGLGTTLVSNRGLVPKN